MSRRSLTVVPTASEEQAHDSFENDADEPVDAVETDEQLDIALEVMADTRATMSEASSDSRVQQPPNTQPVTSRTLQSGLPRTQSDVGSGTNLVKNYRALVSSFKYLKPFMRGPDGNYPAKTVCVLCAAAKPISVFFPCQHMCVCNKCIDANDMMPAFSLDLERCVCPICRDDIRLVLPHTGDEEDTYWHWVLQTEQTLSAEFKNGFKMAGRRLSDSSVKSSVSTVGSITAHLSKNATRPLETSARAYRRGSWAPSISSRVSVSKLGASKKQESCLIL